jgi:hypothetical protein
LVAPFRYCRNTQISDTFRAIPPRHEGRYGQSSRNVRPGCGGRVDAQGRSARDASDEAVWSRHPDAGVKLATETQATVTKTPGTPRRARNKSSNIARGMPDVSGCTCDQLVCVFLSFLHTRPRVQRRPAFPAPSAC